MAQIPGNEMFPDQKTNYGSDNIVNPDTFIVEDNNGTSDWFKPGNARSVHLIVVATQAGGAPGPVKFQMRDAESTEERLLVLDGQVSNGTTANVGIIAGDCMPHEFRLINTAGTASSPNNNASCSLYFNY